ncbi:hypothetical protein SapgrDRAFT_0917 [Saprospira grandis DSM 2844]|uniref:Uncharacterized protein n=1 Tax=Saprospira grandis DSM 2844 TaxID=694433 RepID=J0NYR6_9BACT|nr:hypothetical protein SapgrDRAFT_0917 [Saprospira grandis DSM 2844]
MFSRFSFGAAPAFGWVGLCQGSQVCSALRGLCPLGLRLCRPLFHPSAGALRALAGGFAACYMNELRPGGPKAMQLVLAPKANASCPQAEAALEGLLPEMQYVEGQF